MGILSRHKRCLKSSQRQYYTQNLKQNPTEDTNGENPLPVTTSLKNSTDSVNSSAVFPFHLPASNGTALSSKYTPIAVNFTNFPSISNPLSPATSASRAPRR